MKQITTKYEYIINYVLKKETNKIKKTNKSTLCQMQLIILFQIPIRANCHGLQITS